MNESPITATLQSVLVGRAEKLGPGDHQSAIHKKMVHGKVELTPTGLDGDQVADTVHHGGPEMALHHYPLDHYGAWITDHPKLGPHLTRPGAFGENLSTRNLTEATVCIGDIFTLGSARIQVSQGRQPCWKLNVRFGLTDMALKLQQTGRTGWYYRVLEPGHIGAGDTFTLEDRPHPEWPLSRIVELLYVDTMEQAALREMADLPALAPSWRALAERRLERGRVEDWSGRLDTPASD